MLSKLEAFTRSPDKKDRYLQAVRLLQEAGVYEILRELSLSSPVPVSAPNRMELAASEHFQTIGYQKCLYDLFTLDQITVESQERITADFGAIDRMLQSGEITEQQAKTLRSEGYE